MFGDGLPGHQKAFLGQQHDHRQIFNDDVHFGAGDGFVDIGAEPGPGVLRVDHIL